MNININIKSNTIKEIERELKKNNMMFLDLKHVPFNKFTVTISNTMTLNKAIENVKSNIETKHLDIFSQLELANEIVKESNNNPESITYTINKSDVIMTSSDYEVKQKHTGSVSLPCTIESTVTILSQEFMDEINSYNLKDKRNFTVKINEHCLTILMTVLYTLTKEKNYNIVENKSIKPINSNNKKSRKHNKNKVTYIKTKNINISEITHASNQANNSYARHTESWVQRGHWRNYKNGKRVWIKECVKNAKDKSSIEELNKTYEII